jgi:formylglycine-generating enzyme required for sulfatase activity
MGTPMNMGWDDETPQHFVNINYDFWIGRYPVRVFQYLNYLSEVELVYNNQEFKSEQLDFPITRTNWYDALKYCQWLNKSFRSQFPFGYICRLPTEAEWEKSARGFDGRIWPWGNDFSITCCNTKEGGEKSPSTPGKYSPNGDSPFGVADMAGNVWEWTSTLWGTNNRLYTYPYDPNDGRETIDVPKENYRVIRGGSFYEDKELARCAYRHQYLPLLRSRILGFRVVLAPLKK